MIHTSKQLKDLVRNMSKEIGIDAHILIRKFMMERLLERVSSSKYKDNFILKGGMLVSALVGVEMRATMDIDTSIKSLPTSIISLERIITEISNIPLADNVKFSIKKSSGIMDEAEYPGVRLSMDAILDSAIIPLKIDFSTGDVITPREISYSYKLMFEDRTIPIMAYPVETVLAEKLEAIISRSITNTRMRDFYDIYLLSKLQCIDKTILALAIKRTAKNRGTLNLLAHTKSVLQAIASNGDMRRLWKNYQKKFVYAHMCTWDEIMISIGTLAKEANLGIEGLSVLEKLRQNQKSERD